MDLPPRRRTPPSKLAALVFSITLVVAASGYFTGLQQTASTISQTRPAAKVPQHAPTAGNAGAATDVPQAVEYRRLGVAQLRPNARWANVFEKLKDAKTDLFAFVETSEIDRREAIAARAARRAFDGAPPVVPHPVDQSTSAACLLCHGEGKAIKNRFASKMSHPAFGSCTQCHVPATGTRITDSRYLLAALGENTFTGAAAPSHGTRAWPGAPPTIPHSTLMRDNCASCHGPTGLHGLRTPHPWQQQCVQCHAPDARLDQREFLEVNFHSTVSHHVTSP